jgi:hypothetical protein
MGLHASGASAAKLFRPVPPEHLFGDHVRCVCGETHEVSYGELTREDCGRWFVGVDGGALCYREPEGTEPSVEARSAMTVRREGGEWVEVAA